MRKQKNWRKNLFRDLVIIGLLMVSMPVVLQKDMRQSSLQTTKIIQTVAVEEVTEIKKEASVIISEKENKPKISSTPKITAPMPLTYKIENGKMVCDKKNDRPAKSKKNKRKHMDMECCLDPDEYPNPHCHYPKEKYGKYL